ncbi:MAG TPA: hypothetical protein VL983_10765 [Terriglobales bacterium]|nr:hypothetical protein [Terriglobales bacterium]
MEEWFRFAFIAVFIIIFLRRAFRIKTPSSPKQTTMTQPTMTPIPPRPRQGKKNDFRDIPPPPENPELG